MGRWGLVLLVLAALVGVGAGGVQARRNLRAACGNDDVLTEVHVVLRDRFRIDHIFINGVRTVSGSMLTGRYECTAQIAEIRGNQDASAMSWRGIRYSSINRHPGAPPAVAVDLESTMPLAPPEPKSLWERLFPSLSTRN